MSTPFYLRVSPAGTRAAIDPATGQQDGNFYDLDADDAAAYLPHSCDEWVIGHGSTTEVIAALGQMRTEIDAAIAYLSKPDAPERA